MATQSDIVIVGGGVIGACLAYHFARRRVGRVVLLDKSFPGSGASGKAAALVRTHDSIPLTCAMAEAGLAFYEHFNHSVGGPPVLTRTGMVLIVPASERADLERAAALGHGAGNDLRAIGAQELAQLDPNVWLGEDETAFHEAAAGFLDAVQVVASFTDAARRRGADVRYGVEVKRVLADKGHITGIETNEGLLNCGALVLAMGPWAGSFLRSQKVDLPIEARRTPVALFRRPADLGRRALVLADFVQELYFRPAQGELIQVGSLARDNDPAPADPDDYDEATTSEWLQSVRQRLSRRYPAMHRAFGRGGYSAVHAVTPDRHPIVDRLPDLQGAYCAAGFGGNGFLLAPAIAEVLLAWIVDAKPSPFDVTPLRLARFEEEQPVQPNSRFGLLG